MFNVIKQTHKYNRLYKQKKSAEISPTDFIFIATYAK